MGLIKCIECGTMVSEYASACPSCGCPVKMIKEFLEKKENAEEIVVKNMEEPVKDASRRIPPLPIKHISVDILKLKAELSAKLDPLVEDYMNAKAVKESVLNALTIYDGVLSPNAFQLINTPLITAFDKLIESNKDRRRRYEEEMRVQLRRYNEKSENEYRGPGFSIITNDLASAAMYDLMVARDARNQMNRQIREANAQLLAAFNEVHSNKSIYESELKELLRAIDTSISLLTDLSGATEYLSQHMDSYSEDSSRLLEGCSEEKREIYEFLKDCYQGSEYVVYDPVARRNEALMDQLHKYAYRGYIVLYENKCGGDAFYFTTGKLEYEMFEGSPEPEKDRNLKLWAARFAKPDVLIPGFMFYALTDRGEVLTNKSYNGDTLNKSYEICMRWHDIVRFAECPTSSTWISGLTADGSIRFLYRKFEETGSIIFSINGQLWSKICSYYECGGKAALFEDGTVRFAEDDGTIPEWAKSVSSWNDIIKITLVRGVLTGLTREKTIVMAAEEPEIISQAWKNWTNIIDIFPTYNGVTALTEDGRIVSTKKELENSLQCNNIFRIKVLDTTGGSFAVISSDGRVILNDERDQQIVSEWENVVDITRSYDGTYAVLRSDGTVYASDRLLDVSDWTNVVRIYSDLRCLFGITKDGRILCAGEDENQIFQEISSWKLFDDYDLAFNIEDQKRYIETRLEQERKARKKKLLEDHDKMFNEYVSMKGLFIGGKKAKLKARIDVIEKEIKELDKK